jgi:hypothetical protein
MVLKVLQNADYILTTCDAAIHAVWLQPQLAQYSDWGAVSTGALVLLPASAPACSIMITGFIPSTYNREKVKCIIVDAKID